MIQRFACAASTRMGLLKFKNDAVPTMNDGVRKRRAGR